MLEVGRFGWEEKNRHASFLVASISERINRDIQLTPLQLPAFKLSLPGKSSPQQQTLSHATAQTRRRPSPPHLHKAGEEVQRLVAFFGGVVLAGVSKAAHQFKEGHQARQRSNNLPFYQSFDFPWSNRGTITQSSRESEALARNLIERGREYERALDIRAAVQCFEEAVKLSPTDLAALCLAAKQWTDLTFYHDVQSDKERQLVNLKALEYSERAIAHHPDHFGGYLSACISKGRLALFCDNRTKVKLAKEAQDCARTALALGPDSDLAHHLWARWHYEMAKINVVVRTLVRIMYGTALQPGTKEEALAGYRRAIELAPHRLVHHTEAARVALELGFTEEARESLNKALKCEIEDINAWHTRIDAEMLLAQIERRPWKQPSLKPPGAAQHHTAATAASLSIATLLDESSSLSSPSPPASNQ